MAKVAVREEPDKLNLEETELRLGLPMSRGSDGQSFKSSSSSSCFGGKRGFSETVDLKLNLSSSQGSMEGDGDDDDDDDDGASNKDKTFLPCANDPAKPPPKTQVVGWPPVRSYRKKNILAVQKSGSSGETEKHGSTNNSNATFVKVSMDGAPYLRKVDLKMYKTYQELSKALANLFSSFTTTTGAGGSEGTVKDFMNEITLKDKQNGSDYVVSYEDKDGDWMLIGDVPWGMFVESCKRLRIMKGSEAIGLAPRAMENYKNRS